MIIGYLYQYLNTVCEHIGSGDAFIRQWSWSTLAQVMAWRQQAISWANIDLIMAFTTHIKWQILQGTRCHSHHYCDVIMVKMASKITSLTTVYSTVHAGAEQRKHQSSASLGFVSPVNSPHKWPVTRKMFPFDDVILITARFRGNCLINAI